MIFFTGDQHFGHANIIKHCDRPFGDVHEMDAELIRRHNEVVGPEDVVYHVGDLAYKNARSVDSHLAQLNGHHWLLRGNHDRWALDRPDVPDMREVTIGERLIVICHYALRTWHHSGRGSWQIHGHSHGKLPPLTNQCDVGVDTNNYYPLSLEQVRQRINP